MQQQTRRAVVRQTTSCRQQKTLTLEGRAYLQELSKFVGSKPHSEQPADILEQRSSMQSHLQKRKLMQVNHETRFNRIMDGFKCLDTFVDVKSLVKEMERIELEAEESVVEQPAQNADHKPTRTSERLIADINQLSPYLKLIERANRQIASQQDSYARKETFQLNELVEQLGQLSRFNRRQLDESYPIDAFQAAMYCRLMEQQETMKRLPTSPDSNNLRQPPKESSSSFHPSKQHQPHIDSDYYRKFKQKTEDMQNKLHHMLESMHMAKWKDRKKHVQHSTNSQPQREKPLLDGKYRIHAPKNYFRFKDVDNSLKKFKLSNRQPLSTICTRENTQRNAEGRRPHATKVSPHHSKAPVHLQRKPRGTEPHFRHHRDLQSKTFTDMKQLHQDYSFKKPLIKGNILRRIVEFIDEVEKEQFEFRRHNEQMCGHISKLEANKQADFDRFLEQRVDVNIEDVQNFCQRQRSHPS